MKGASGSTRWKCFVFVKILIGKHYRDDYVVCVCVMLRCGISFFIFAEKKKALDSCCVYNFVVCSAAGARGEYNNILK